MDHLFPRWEQSAINQNYIENLDSKYVVKYCERRHFRAVHISRISRRPLDARKFDVSENYSHYKSNRIN